MPGSAVCRAILLLLAVACFAAFGAAQTEPVHVNVVEEDEVPPALVRSARIVMESDGPAVEIITTRPTVPVITQLQGPSRVVIDMPKSFLPEKTKIAFRNDQISRVRIDQYKKKPPMVRMVLELTKPCGVGWDEAGNRLMIRIHPQQPNPAVASASPNSPILAQGEAPASADGNEITGAVIPASSGAVNNSSVTATGETTIVRLERGGELRVCAGTTVSVTSSENGRDLMMGMSTGALEAHYQLDASADAVMTPDFRILLAGPGRFDFAISADSRGNTCVRALPGNTSTAVVSELMGDGVYRVKPTEQVVFRGGRLAARDADVPADCGCPTSAVPVMRVATTVPANSGVASADAAAAASPSLPVTSAALQTSEPSAANVPASQSNDVHVQIEAPLVFRASDLPADRASAENKTPSPDNSVPSQAAASSPPSAEMTPTQPDPAPQPVHRSFFGRFKSAISSLFR